MRRNFHVLIPSSEANFSRRTSLSCLVSGETNGTCHTRKNRRNAAHVYVRNSSYLHAPTTKAKTVCFQT